MNKQGSNQYKLRNKYPLGLKFDTYISVLELIIFILFIAIAGKMFQPKIISPISDNPVFAFDPTPSPVPLPTRENVVAYIAKKFSGEGQGVLKTALDISFCESGWRPDAFHINNNKSTDHGPFQINSIHTKRYGSLFKTNWQENINVAYKIYKQQGWNPWVCYAKVK